MQDRFKFRGFGKSTAPKLIQGMHDIKSIEISEKGYYGISFESNWISFIEKEQLELMQSTGLRDKNGKLIFEGDIVERKGFNPAIKRGVVIWDKENLCFKVKNMSLYSLKNRSKIISNIYENPELLEEQKC